MIFVLADLAFLKTLFGIFHAQQIWQPWSAGENFVGQSGAEKVNKFEKRKKSEKNILSFGDQEAFTEINWY